MYLLVYSFKRRKKERNKSPEQRNKERRKRPPRKINILSLFFLFTRSKHFINASRSGFNYVYGEQGIVYVSMKNPATIKKLGIYI